MFLTRRTGTGIALGVALMLSHGAGCVLPPQGEELPELVNQPPRIDVQSLAPSPFTNSPKQPPLLMGRNCTSLFTVSVSDPEADDLYYRVFLDYFLLDPVATRPDPVPVEPLNITTRSQTITFRPDGALFGVEEPHTVELFLVDRPFSPLFQDPPGRVLTDPDGKVDSFIWTVTLDDSRCP